jgi:hypothetical protein
MNIVDALVGFLVGALVGGTVTWQLRGHIVAIEDKLHAKVNADVAAVTAKVDAVAAEVKKV